MASAGASGANAWGEHSSSAARFRAAREARRDYSACLLGDLLERFL
jgi:hypothetical protein